MIWRRSKPYALVYKGSAYDFLDYVLCTYVLALTLTSMYMYSTSTNNEVYYDEEYDDTPYNLKDLYKEQEKTMEPAKFKAFLIENLRSKHINNVENVGT